MADVTGAGDTVVAVLAACLGSGWDLAEACRLANVAAGIAVSHPGTYVVHADELAMAWKGLSHKVLNRESARRRLAEARRRGRKVVFTNGCFDILHAGHLACLEGAKRLGDLLVVGLNSDASVRGLKGDSRPVIGQENRASLLAGLACVDVVVIFDEPTPEELIRQLDPDVLVKGGDYTMTRSPAPTSSWPRRPGRRPAPGARPEHDRDPRAEGPPMTAPPMRRPSSPALALRPAANPRRMARGGPGTHEPMPTPDRPIDFERAAIRTPRRAAEQGPPGRPGPAGGRDRDAGGPAGRASPRSWRRDR